MQDPGKRLGNSSAQWHRVACSPVRRRILSQGLQLLGFWANPVKSPNFCWLYPPVILQFTTENGPFMVDLPS